TKLHALAKLTQSFLRTLACIAAQLKNNVSRFRKVRRKLISQRAQHTGREAPITRAALDNRQLPFRSELDEVAGGSFSKPLPAFRACSIVACPAPTLAIRALIVAAVPIVQCGLHP